MRKFAAILLVLASFLTASAAHADYKFNPHTNKKDYYEPQATASAPQSLATGGTGESLSDPASDRILGWDDTDNEVKFMVIGDGLSYDEATDTLSASSSSGDVTGVGDCASGACGDGSSDGGTYYRLYDGDSHYTQIASADVAGNVTITLPAVTSTVATLAGTETLTNKTLAAADNVIEADTGDSATSFFSTGTIEDARLPSTMDAKTLTGGTTLSNGATSAGYLDFVEDSDNGSNYVRLIGPASTANITLTLPSSDGDADQLLKTDGSGNMSWVTVSAGSGDITAVGNCTTGACFDGSTSSGSALTFDHGTGTYGADGTITFDPSNNKFTIMASALTDAGGSQSTIAEFIPINTATHQIGQIVVKGINNYGGVTRLGGGGNGGYWAGSIPAQAGAGFAAWGADIYPASHTAGESTTVSPNNGGVNLGTASYRWNNVYSEDGNFSGAVTTTHLALTPTTVASLGTATAGLVKMISDGADATDCTTGAGSTHNLCFANGSAWVDA